MQQLINVNLKRCFAQFMGNVDLLWEKFLQKV